jgi:hypothetical protein
MTRHVDEEAPAAEASARPLEQRRPERGVAAGERDQALGPRRELLPAQKGLALAAAGVPEREQTTQIPVARGALDQQQQRTRRGVRGRRLERDVGPHDRVQPRGLGGLKETRRAREAVAIGEGQGAVAEVGGAGDQVFGVGGGLQEGEGAAAAQLDVVGRGGRGHGREFRSTFVSSSSAPGRAGGVWNGLGPHQDAA